MVEECEGVKVALRGLLVESNVSVSGRRWRESDEGGEVGGVLGKFGLDIIADGGFRSNVVNHVRNLLYSKNGWTPAEAVIRPFLWGEKHETKERTHTGNRDTVWPHSVEPWLPEVFYNMIREKEEKYRRI